MFLFTGNNLTLQGDLVRRLLVCRIDPRSEKPFERSFNLDPLAHVRDNRSAMIAAALTLLRGSLTSKFDKPEGRMASFEAWSDLVRNAVCWISSEVELGEFADPMSAVTRAMEHDPELELYVELLEALRHRFGDATFTSSDIHKAVQNEPNLISCGKAHRIWEAMVAINEKGCPVCRNHRQGAWVPEGPDRGGPMCSGKVSTGTARKASGVSRLRVVRREIGTGLNQSPSSSIVI
jgi:hypothetical protein